MKKIFFISRLDIWYIGKKGVKTAGNQTMYNTIKGYLDNGFDVVLLTSGDEYSDYSGTDIEKLKIIRSKFIYLTKFKVILKKILLKSQKKVEKNDFITGTEHKPYSSLTTLYLWSVFSFLEGLFFNIKYRADIFYGYEYSGVLPAYWLGKMFGKPVVSRYQGTRLGFFLDSPKQFDMCKDTIVSMKTPVNLNIMGDDGTQGDLVFSKLGISPDKFRLWINGVSDKEYIYSLTKDDNFKKEYNIPEGAKIIVSSNRFDFWKRIDRLVNVFSEISKMRDDIYLILVGDGGNKAYIEELARELNVHEKIRFMGALPHKKALGVIRQADIYMTLCDYTNLSNSVIEAQVMGIPVVTLSVGGVSKIIENSKNGYLFDLNRIDEIPLKIDCLLRDKDMYLKMSYEATFVGKTKLLSWKDRMKLEVNEVSALL